MGAVAVVGGVAHRQRPVRDVVERGRQRQVFLEDALQREVAQLEATEDAVRERTRDSRIKFTGAIVCIVAVILVIIAIWLLTSK